MPSRERLLICPPTHYTVAYEINPWMNVQQQPDRALAQRQWKELTSLLRRQADAVTIDPIADAPDMVFTANAGLVLGRHVLLSRFRHPQRRIEEPRFRRWFERQGYTIVALPPQLCFEGEGDALSQPDSKRIWFGHGIRSDLEVLPHLRRAYDGEIIPLRLVDPSFYHLDTCFCPLPGGHIMYYPKALDADSRMRLYTLVPAERRIEIGEDDAKAFACNALVLGTTAIMNGASAALRARLARVGLTVMDCPVGEFMRAGGAVKCLNLRLDHVA